jgi:glycine C-acetyltransferase
MRTCKWFRAALVKAGFKPPPRERPILPIIIGETRDGIAMSDALLEEGIFVTGFGFPGVPHARVRCQVSAAH